MTYVRETFNSLRTDMSCSHVDLLLGQTTTSFSKTLTITFTNCQVYEYLKENTSILK